MKYHKIGLIFVLLLTLNCSYFTQHGRALNRAQKAYQTGSYDTAVSECVYSLKNKPDYEKALQLMDVVFPVAVRTHHNKIERLESSSEKFTWDKIVTEYQRLIHLVDLVNSLLTPQVETWKFKAGVMDYSTLIISAKNKASEVHYLEGKKLMLQDSRDSYKKGAAHFKTAQEFTSNYKDSESLYDECRKSALIQIAILPFENKSGKNKYNGIGETLTNEIISKLLANGEVMEFIDIVSRDQLNLIIEEQKFSHSGLVDDDSMIELGNIQGVHHLIIGDVTQVMATKPKRSKDKRRITRDVVIDKETYKDNKGKTKKRNIYGKVHATLTIHEIVVDATVTASYQIIDVETSKILSSDNLTGTAHFEHNWGTYRGDKRALGYRENSLVREKEIAPPSKEEMILRAGNKLSDKLINSITDELK
ncbi:MAG: hypothetical protein ISR90_03380 [Candidatus Marinimicrobia bacterium]|nr:hypothetical protein [Candidatus Neomarinimicrobiota bacterium]MBL7023081.1 hypothetical protein [Candidatus Neomarinimicrobiota bacterium]MBL7109101.1 hypothetical protein [Candidatus Neomarinimicrobiota bacterium]